MWHSFALVHPGQVDLVDRVPHIVRFVLGEHLDELSDLLGNWAGLLAIVRSNDKQVGNGLGQAKSDVDDIVRQSHKSSDEEVFESPLVGRRTDKFSQAPDETRRQLMFLSIIPGSPDAHVKRRR